MRPTIARAVALAVLLPCAVQAEVFINEFHYDNDKGDVGEFIEVALLSSLPPADYGIVLYNGSPSSLAQYGTTRTLDTCTAGESNNNYTLYTCDYPANGIQNGSPDGPQPKST